MGQPPSAESSRKYRLVLTTAFLFVAMFCGIVSVTSYLQGLPIPGGVFALITGFWLGVAWATLHPPSLD